MLLLPIISRCRWYIMGSLSIYHRVRQSPSVIYLLSMHTRMLVQLLWAPRLVYTVCWCYDGFPPRRLKGSNQKIASWKRTAGLPFVCANLLTVCSLQPMDATSECTSALPWALKSLWSVWWASQLLTWTYLKISQPITSTCFQVMTSAVKDVLKWKPELTTVLKDNDGQSLLSHCHISLSQIPKPLSVQFSSLALFVCLLCFLLSLRLNFNSVPLPLWKLF